MRKPIGWDQFREALGEELIEKIVQDMRAGFKDSVQLLNAGNDFGYPVEYEIRTKANLAHDHMRSRLKSSLSETLNVKTGKWNGIFAITVGDDAFCRIKKFLKGGRVSVTLTAQQRKFNNQATIPGIPDLPALITIGYYEDKPWTKILSIYASCYTADGLEWYQKFGGEGFSQLNLFDSPISPRTPRAPITPKSWPSEISSNEQKKKRVTGKKDPKKDTGTEN